MGQVFRQSHAGNAATLAGMDLKLLADTLASAGEPAFRLQQIWEWTARGAASYEEMTNIPAALRERLADEVPLSSLSLEREALARDGTEKALFMTADGRPIEAVLMRYRDGRRSLCLSSQSGCPLTCTFCATGPDEVRPQPHGVRDPRPGAALPAQRGRSTTPSSWGWASRC